MRHPIPILLGAAALAAAAAGAIDKPSFDAGAAAMGATTFRTYCATCHGREANGEGPLADSLRVRPPDLTRLAARNKGEYSFETVRRIIDGRNPVKGHGGADMPVWGDAFLNATNGYDKDAVHERIQQVVHYIASLQR